MKQEIGADKLRFAGIFSSEDVVMLFLTYLLASRGSRGRNWSFGDSLE